VHIDGVLVDEWNSFGQQALFHYVRMTESPSPTEKSIPIDHPVKRKIQIGRRPRDRPTNLPRTARVTQRTSNIAVARDSAARNLPDDLEDLLCQPFRMIWCFDWLVHQFLQRYSRLAVKPEPSMPTLYSPVRRFQRPPFDPVDDHHPKGSNANAISAEEGIWLSSRQECNQA
jgi:hypothetical protein